MVWWTLALSAAQGISSASTQKKNADAANKAQRQFERLNAQFANEDLMQSYVALGASRIQERTALAGSLDAVTLDATRRIGAVSVAAGASGLHGNTQAALVNDFKIAQLKSEGAIMQTEQYMQEQYDRDVKAARSQRDSRVLMGKQQRVQGPSYMQLFIDGFTNYMQMEGQQKQANKLPYGDPGATGGGGGYTPNPAGSIPANSPNSGLQLPTY